MEYQSDYVLRIIEQVGAMLREAIGRFRDGAESRETLELTEHAIGLVVDIDPELFLRMSPQSMVSLVEIADVDNRLIVKLAEALELEAEILSGEGAIVQASVRREQATAMRNAIDPAHAN